MEWDRVSEESHKTGRTFMYPNKKTKGEGDLAPKERTVVIYSPSRGYVSNNPHDKKPASYEWVDVKFHCYRFKPADAEERLLVVLQIAPDAEIK